MELDYIKEFVELAKTCNFQEAADTLFIAQSTLSRHIKALEAELGISLFIRTTRTVKLSGAARAFLPYAQQLVETAESGLNAIAEYEKASQGTIAIGAIPSMSYYRVNELLYEFTQKHKYLSLNLIEGDTMELVQMLQDGILDFAYIRDADEDNEMWQQFSKINIGIDYLSVVISKKHKFASLDSISIEELQHEKFLLLEKNSFAYSLSILCCHKAGFEPNVVFTGKHARNLISMVASGLGVLLLNERSAEHYKTDDVKILKLVPEIKTQICLAYTDEVKMTKAAQFFLDYVRQ